MPVYEPFFVSRMRLVTPAEFFRVDKIAVEAEAKPK
jgi:hypothetical protein